jgi:AcrR family transcriptional regulator
VKGLAPEVKKMSEPMARRGAGRAGRPPRKLAGSVDDRILDAASKVFAERGFSAASVDEIAEVARDGKPTIYARFTGKEALLTAVIERVLRRNTGSCAAAAIQNRLEALAAASLTAVLAPETNGLIRVAVAEARRFPDLAASVGRVARERQVEAVTRLFVEFAESDQAGAPPAFAPDRLASTAGQFLDLAVSPILLRALMGEDLSALRAQIGPHVARSVAFFLAGCSRGGDGG